MRDQEVATKERGSNSAKVSAVGGTRKKKVIAARGPLVALELLRICEFANLRFEI
jgi:hypothetical protein